MGIENNNADDHDLDDDLDQDSGESGSESTELAPGEVVLDDEGNAVVADDASSQETDEDRTAIREARRQERQDRKARAKEKDDRLRRELAGEREARRQLEDRLAVIERKSSGSEIAQLDDTLEKTKNAYKFHKAQLEKAYAEGNGAMASEATEKMMIAKGRIDDIGRIKEAVVQRGREAPPLDQRLVNHARGFMDKHSWYRPDGNDTDSSVTRTIDNQLASEGFDPKTPEYWEELESRVKKYLPHRANRATVPPADTARQKSVVSGSGSGDAGASGSKGTFKLSSARVSALKDAGMWDDPKLRADAVKRYREYDQNQKGR